MTQYFGDFSEDQTVYIPFNTFDSNDPSASVTITNLVAGDIKVHKDGSTAEIVTDGATVAIDFDGVTGQHLITVDTSAHADYSTGSDYLVRIEGTTVDGATINAWVGSFSIENRHSAGALRPTIAGRTLDVTAGGAAALDWGNVENQTASVNLSNTTTNLVNTITTYTGNTVQTGDSFARLGAPAGASVSADIAAAQTDLDTITGSDGVTLATTQGAITFGAMTIDVSGASNNLTFSGSGSGDGLVFSRSGSGGLFGTNWAAALESEVNDALVALGLDHLFGAAITDTDVTNNSFAALITSNSATADFDDYNNLTDSLPALSNSLGSVANVGSAVHKPANSYTLTTGTQSANTFAETEALDGTKHEHTDAAGAMELYYEFLIGSGTPSSVQVTGLINGNNDSVDVYGYDWVSTSWKQIGTLSGQADTSTNTVRSYDLFVDMVGTGADEGKVRVRFYYASGLTSATLRIDQIFVAFSQGSEGYDNGSIWIDTSFSNTNTEVGIDGVARNPVSTIAAANTLEGLTNLHRFYIAPESSITFAASQQDQSFLGDEWTLALGGQDISGTKILGASRGVSGTCSGATSPFFETCSIGAVTSGPAAFDRCGFTSTLTVGSAGDFFLIDCFSQVAGASSPTLDMGAAVGASNVSIRRWAGGITINNLAAGDVVSLDGNFGTVTLNGADATVEIRGIAKAVVNNLTGSPTVNDDSLKADDVAAILADTADMQPKLGTPVDTDLATDIANVQTSADGAATPAEVNAEVVDALATDTYAESSGVPAATAPLSDKISWLATLARNKITQTATTQTLRNDADSADVAASTVSDDGTTATRGEFT